MGELTQLCGLAFSTGNVDNDDNPSLMMPSSLPSQSLPVAINQQENLQSAPIKSLSITSPMAGKNNYSPKLFIFNADWLINDIR